MPKRFVKILAVDYDACAHVLAENRDDLLSQSLIDIAKANKYDAGMAARIAIMRTLLIRLCLKLRKFII
jgi:hypothetical protein